MTKFQQHEFKAEWVKDEHGTALMLTQSDGYSEPQCVLAHPWQFRAVFEHFGIVPSGDAEARRTIAALGRRLIALADRIGSLNACVSRAIEHEPRGLVVQAAMLEALACLAGEWAEEARALQANAGLEDASERPESAERTARRAQPAKVEKTPQRAML